MEAVIAVPVLAIIMSMMVFMWRVYTLKVAAMAVARQQVWTYAQSTNCGNAGSGSKGYTDPSVAGSVGVAGGSGLPSSPADQADPYAAAGGGGDKLHSDLGTASVVAPTVLVTAGMFGGGDSAEVGSKQYVTCNEPPYDGNLINVGKEAIHDLTSWSFWK